MQVEIYGSTHDVRLCSTETACRIEFSGLSLRDESLPLGPGVVETRPTATLTRRRVDCLACLAKMAYAP